MFRLTKFWLYEILRISCNLKPFLLAVSYGVLRVLNCSIVVDYKKHLLNRVMPRDQI